MRVLFVEDDAMNRRVVRDMLAVVGVDMAEADHAEAGLRMIDAATYDIVLMDLRMPGMDGLAAIRHIRARKDIKAATPIIVVTADGADDLHAACLAAGANGVLPKPVAMEALYEALAGVAPGDVLL